MARWRTGGTAEFAHRIGGAALSPLQGIALSVAVAHLLPPTLLDLKVAVVKQEARRPGSWNKKSTTLYPSAKCRRFRGHVQMTSVLRGGGGLANF